MEWVYLRLGKELRYPAGHSNGSQERMPEVYKVGGVGLSPACVGEYATERYERVIDVSSDGEISTRTLRHDWPESARVRKWLGPQRGLHQLPKRMRLTETEVHILFAKFAEARTGARSRAKVGV